MASGSMTKGKTAALTLGALGVVYGDIGTSPLYAIKEAFVETHGLPLTPDNVMGLLSLIFWALLLVVSGKYVLFMLRADNNGEGGIMSLMALALRRAKGRTELRIVTFLGIFGACLFYGDGVVTPAISVLSAVEGLEVATPAFKPYVVPLALVVLAVLFIVQHHGTGVVGRFFGPLMAVWFLSLGLLGLVQIAAHPEVLAAVNPLHAVHFFEREKLIGFIALGAVVLALTGAEALYADMGHFGRQPIRYAWFGMVLPCLVLNYFGQGALLIVDPATKDNPFFHMAPDWLLYPLVGMATLATVIASQAMISGAFSVARQAMHLGYSPRLDVQHTSSTEKGQIYLPTVNWLQMSIVALLVVGFGSSTNLAAAYGVAATGSMLASTLLCYFLLYRLWKLPLWIVAAVVGSFLCIDIAFFTSNATKIFHGGWFPLAFGGLIFLLMLTWRQGRELVYARFAEDSMGIDLFITTTSNVTRVGGTAAFMTPSAAATPHALLHNLKHNRVLHERVVLISIKVQDVPRVDPMKRLTVETLPNGFYRVEILFGFMESPNVPRYLLRCKDHGLDLDPEQTSFFLGRETLMPNPKSEMALWRQALFIAMMRNSRSAAHYFRLPPNRVVELGAQISI